MEEVTVGYDYNRETKLGHMSMGEALVEVYVIEECSPNLFHCMKINHPNQIAYKLRDAPRNRMLCERFSCTLKQYLARKKMILSFHSFTYLEPSVRKAFRDILTFINDMNDTKVAVDSFTADNLVVVGDVVKFIGVGLRPKTSGHRNRNISNVKEVLLELLPLTTKPLPRDYEKFIASFTLPNSASFTLPNFGKLEADCLLHHLCLMPPRSILRFIESVGSTPRNTAMAVQLTKVISVFEDCSNWYKNLYTPGLEDLRSCYENDKTKYILVKPSGSSRYPELTLSQYRCCRNLVIHATIPLTEPENVGEIQGETVVIKRQVLILNAFMNELCLLQRRLCVYANPHKWFE